jgi:hypothetical protein
MPKNMYEINITKHWSGKTYNVGLTHWQKNEGVNFGRAFDVSKEEAEKEAKHQATLYNAKIIREE